MLKLSAFKLGTIQDCLHILNECESEGVIDVRFVRQRLADHVHAEGLSAKMSMRVDRKQLRVKPMPCPECGSPLGKSVVDGLIITHCKNCRWSAVDGEAR